MRISITLVLTTSILLGCNTFRDSDPTQTDAGSDTTATCTPGFDDCDPNIPGCETPITQSLRNCGACGVSCGSGELCVDGGCVCGDTSASGAPACGNNLACCAGACIAPSDPACICGSGERCEVSQLCCDDTCVESASDEAHCGACGVTCPTEQVCAESTCVDAATLLAQDDTWGQVNVDLSGSWAVVGVPAANGGTGEAHVYQRQGETWSLNTTLTGTDAIETPGKAFGAAVAISGTRIAIGAPFQTELFEATGAVYVFDLINNQWIQTFKLQSFESQARDHLGSSLAIDGNFVVAGAPEADFDDLEDAGRVHIFQNDKGWEEVMPPLQASDASAFATFGASVDMKSGNIVVGSPTVSTSGGPFDHGALYRFVPTNIGVRWRETHILTASDRADSDQLGDVVALTDDGLTLIGAAPQKTLAAGSFTGSVYIFSGDGSTPFTETALRPQVGRGRFGSDLDVGGDTLLVGARDEPAVYVFTRGPNGDFIPDQTLLPQGGLDSNFGWSVATDSGRALVSAQHAVLSFVLR